MKATLVISPAVIEGKESDDVVDIEVTFDPAPTDMSQIMPIAPIIASSLVSAFSELTMLKYGKLPINKLSIPQLNQEYNNKELAKSTVHRITAVINETIEHINGESENVQRTLH